MNSQQQVLKETTVLVVEDDPMTRHSLARLIGYRVKKVFEARNGRDGLEQIDEHQPHIVVCDLEMPVMSGMEMVARLREKGNRIPVIVITAFNDEHHLVPTADAYMVKPLSKEKLLQSLTELAQRVHGTEQSISPGRLPGPTDPGSVSGE